jgi:hypothetical protein
VHVSSRAREDGRETGRRGNQNPTVGIYRYVVERSFDSYSWQTVERKARFIDQLMRGRLDVREIEDLVDDVIGFAQLKAITSGDPLILEKAKVDDHTTSTRQEITHGALWWTFVVSRRVRQRRRACPGARW